MVYIFCLQCGKKIFNYTPNINLVENLGLKGGTTRSLDLKTNLSLLKLNNPLLNPKRIKRDFKKDIYVFRNVYKYSFLKKMKNKIIKFLK